MKIKFFASLTLGSLIVSLLATAAPKDNSRKREKTAFQTSGSWKPEKRNFCCGCPGYANTH